MATVVDIKTERSMQRLNLADPVVKIVHCRRNMDVNIETGEVGRSFYQVLGHSKRQTYLSRKRGGWSPLAERNTEIEALAWIEEWGLALERSQSDEQLQPSHV